MSSLVAFAVAVGTILGLGLWILVSSIPRIGGLSLARRVAPFVADLSPEAFRLSTRLSGDPGAVAGSILATIVANLSFLGEGLLGSRADTMHRLNQAGGSVTLQAFRGHQVLWALGGLAVGLLCDVTVGLVGSPTIGALLAFPVMGLVAGYAVAAFALRRRAMRRTARITSELPTVFEFMSLCLAAGESITDSLRRVALVGRGEFAGELAFVTRQVDAGVPLATALQEVSDRLHIPAVTRGLEQILGALDRGSPLAVVLQAQAQDAREDSKRDLLEKAGQKEVVMLIPLVFLILPVTILFAFFPGLLVVQSGL